MVKATVELRLGGGSTYLICNLFLSRYYAKLKKMEEEREQELANKYRDRVSCHEV